jgi:hypothetical protein
VNRLGGCTGWEGRIGEVDCLRQITDEQYAHASHGNSRSTTPHEDKLQSTVSDGTLACVKM